MVWIELVDRGCGMLPEFCLICVMRKCHAAGLILGQTRTHSSQRSRRAFAVEVGAAGSRFERSD
jgi:hypothetical protein